MRGFAASVAISFLLILMLWLVGPLLGFHVSLVGSLALTIGLTLLLNLVMGAMSRRDSRGWR